MIPMSSQKVVLAAVAHPDDIEFMMAGTLLRLQRIGWEIHFWNLASGCCGSLENGRVETAAIRLREAAASASLAGAIYHAPLFEDLEVFFDKSSLARVAAVVRGISPSMILTHSPSDYMMDHENVCRLIVTAAFSKGMPNFPTNPPRDPSSQPVRIYHALPHGLRDDLGRPPAPDLFVDVSEEIAKKRDLLACHASQKRWLDASQSMDAYLDEMEFLCREMASMSGRCEFAEAFLRHHHLGFCPPEFDPIQEITIQ